MKCALKDYRNELLDFNDALDQIDTALVQIDREIKHLLEEQPGEPDYDYDDYYIRESSDSEYDTTRSVFDDVDS